MSIYLNGKVYFMDRYLLSQIKEDCQKKVVLITGPRQAGKTTLSKMLTSDFQYLNFDLAEHRDTIREKSWDRKKSLIIFDELHKMENWKSWLKGIFDVEGSKPSLIVTGSAKLSAFKKVGDSLAGRHFEFMLHPIDFKEAAAFTEHSLDEIFSRLMQVGGFPEPFLKGKPTFYRRWQKSHINMILREDLLDLSAVRDIKSIELLIDLLRSRVGSPVSTNSLASDLQKSPKTVKNWLQLLEDLYVIFKVTPFHKNIARAILKEPKYYFYDTPLVKGDDGIKLENLVACSLLKEVQYLTDVKGIDRSLHYLRNKDGFEIDFVVLDEETPTHLFEVKWSDTKLSGNFKKFSSAKTSAKAIQLIGQPNNEKTFPGGEEVRWAPKFLANLKLD